MRRIILPLLGERAGVRAGVRFLPIIVLRIYTRRNISDLWPNQFNSLPKGEFTRRMIFETVSIYKKLDVWISSHLYHLFQ
jgi:hypothetical protein